MKNIILLGHKSSIGRSFYNTFKNDFLFTLIDRPEFNVLNKNSVNKILQKIDLKKKYLIINCIGLMGADQSKKGVENFININGIFPSEIFEYFKKFKIEKYIFLSSETVYGSGNNYKEEDEKNPLHPYAISKLIAELNIRNRIKMQKINFPTIILRVPIVIFNKQKFHNTLTSIFDDYLNKKTISIFGNGRHKRGYIFHSDLNKALGKIILTKKERGLNILNIPSVKANSLEISSHISKKVGQHKKFNFIKSNKSFTLTSNAKKFEKKYNFFNKYNLKRIIEEYGEANK